MARKLRIESAGGLYHVINRGNDRRDVFETEGASHSFVEGVSEAVKRQGWRLQAYVLMRNHFHSVLETPEPNLTQGMHWLLSTVAMRFNRYRSERGHLFQGRFHALAKEQSDAVSLSGLGAREAAALREARWGASWIRPSLSGVELRWKRWRREKARRGNSVSPWKSGPAAERLSVGSAES